MTASEIISPEEKAEIAATACRSATARTKGELAEIVAREAGMYSLADLQAIGGRLFLEVDALPEPYRAAPPVLPGSDLRCAPPSPPDVPLRVFRKEHDPIRDRETFDKFCAIIP